MLPKRTSDSSQRMRRSSAMRPAVIKASWEKNRASRHSHFVVSAADILAISSSERTRSRSSYTFLVRGLRGTLKDFMSCIVYTAVFNDALMVFRSHLFDDFFNGIRVS